MKKILCSVLLPILVFASVFPQVKSNAVQVLLPDLENISSKDSGWLPGQIQDKLKENLQDYAGFITVVDSSNENQLKELQRKSEGSGYDSATVIEAGHITNASSAVFSTIRKAGSVYIISLNYMDLRTGVHETVTSSGKSNLEDLFNTPGCAVDELTERLCEKLGIRLSATQKYVLSHGRAELSVDQQIAMARQDSENYEKQLADLERQISSFSVSADLNAENQQQKLKAEKALLEEKQASAERRMRELNEQQRKKIEDAEKEQRRSIEVIQKRNEIEKKAAQKALAVRALKMDNESILGKISVIENKKRALVEIRQSVSMRAKEIQDEATKEADEKAAEMNAKPYSRAEMKNGQPIRDAVIRRQNQIAQEKNRIYKTANENIKRMQDSVAKQERELYEGIHQDYRKIQGTQTVSSLGEELKCTYGPYDAERQSWPVNIYLYCDNILLTEDKIEIKYSELSGKTPPAIRTISESALQEYSDDVDMYDSLLSRGSQILRYEMDYRVVPEAESKPSAYRFYFDELRVYDTISGRVLSRPSLSRKARVRQMSPAYDIRTGKTIASDTRRENLQNYRNTHFRQSSGGGEMTGFYFSLGWSKEEKIVFDINLKYAFSPYAFMFVGGGMTSVPEELRKITDDYGLWHGLAGFGFNWRPFILFYPPSLYVRAGAGLAGHGLDGCHYLDTTSSSMLFDSATYYMCQFAAGLEIPLTKKFALYGEGRFDWIFEAGKILSVSVGASIIDL